MSEMFERPPALTDNDRDFIIGEMAETGHDHRTVWLDKGSSGAYDIWLNVLAEANIWERDVVWPRDGPVEMPQKIDCVNGEGTILLKRIDHSNQIKQIAQFAKSSQESTEPAFDVDKTVFMDLKTLGSRVVGFSRDIITLRRFLGREDVDYSNNMFNDEDDQMRYNA